MKYISILVQHHVGPTGNVLIGKNADGAWEFPNGRAYSTETEADAVKRIAWEVLGMDVIPGKLALIGHKAPQDGSVEHIYYGNITHNTHTKCDYRCYYEAINKWQVEPKSTVYSEFKWVHPSELCQYDFAGDDVNFMAKYAPWISGQEIPDRRMP